MPRILAVAGKEPCAVQTALDNAQFHIQYTHVHNVLTLLQDATAQADVILLGEDIQEPISLAQRIRALDKEVAIVLVAEPRYYDRLRRALRYSPFLGAHTHCISQAVGPGINYVCADAAKMTKSRRRHVLVRASSRNKLVAHAPSSRQRTSQHLDHLLTHAPIGVALLDERRCIVSANPRATTLLRASETELLGQELHTLLGQEATTLMPQHASPSKLRCQTCLSGQELVLEVTSSWLPFSRGGSFLVMLEDVTAQEQATRALQSARAAAEASSKAKGRFLAVMSHEVRTPIAGILGLSDLLREQHQLPGQVDHHLGTIRDSAEALLKIVNDILDHSKLEANKLNLERVSFNLSRVLQDVLELLRAKIQNTDVEIQLCISAEVPEWLTGDPGRLRQIMLNLVGNAAKFTSHGYIKINIYPDPERGADGFSFEVRDSGIGMTQEQASRVFESYAQAESNTARKYGGTGLGLTISKELVERMGGTLKVDSELGVGTRFWFSLVLPPGRQPQSSLALQRPVTAPPCNTVSGRRVLVAEDNPVMRQVAHAMLDRLGCKVTFANNGQEAVQAVESDDYDVVLMDMEMPLMDGREAARRIRATGEKGELLPIIAVTANADTSDQDACLAAGMDHYLSKPLRMEHLKAALTKCFWVDSPE